MRAKRQRVYGTAAAALALVWLLAWGGYEWAKHARATADKLRAYMESVSLSALTGEARAQALREAARQLNALSPEERRKARVEQLWRRWFEQMTEEERASFVDATMPSGFKQMLGAFEQMPEAQRRRAVADSLRRLKQAQDEMASENPEQWREQWGTNQPVALSDELQQRVTRIGLNTFYSQSSAQTKAELAPVLEELQRAMESGRLLRRPHP